MKKLEALQSGLTKMYFEEKRLERELNVETFYLNRNQLTINLLEEDIAVFNRRRNDSLNKKCFKLENQVAPDISLRSPLSDDIELLVLKSLLHQKLSGLNNAKTLNRQLKEDLNYKQNMYNTMLEDIQLKLKTSAGDLNMIKNNVSELQDRLNQESQKVALMKYQLLGLLKENKVFGNKIKQLKLNIQEFNHDSACYVKIISEDFLQFPLE